MLRCRPSGGWLMRVLFIAMFAIAARPAAAQLLLVDDFPYPPLTLLSANGWLAHASAGTNPIRVTNGGLTYPGYPSAGIGNAAGPLATSGEDDNRGFAPVNTGNLYASAMVQVMSAGIGDYFFHFSNQNVALGQFPGRLAVRSAGPTQFQLGISMLTEPPLFGGPAFPYGTTVLAILKYRFNPGANDDQVQLILNPTLPGTEPSPIATAMNPAGLDPPNLGAVCIRQGTAGGAPVANVDGVRIGRTYADVAGPPPPVWTISASAGAGGSIAPSGAVMVTNGNSQPFQIMPSPGFIIDDVVVDGVSRGPVSQYLFTNVTTNHTIGASFLVDRSPPLGFHQIDFYDAQGNPLQLDSGFGEVQGQYSTDGSDAWTNIIVRRTTMIATPFWAARNMFLSANPPAQSIEDLTARFPLDALGITPGTALDALEYDIRVTPQPMTDASAAQWMSAAIWRSAVSVTDVDIMSGDAVGIGGAPVTALPNELSFYPSFLLPFGINIAGWIGCKMSNVDLDNGTHPGDTNGCVPAACANSMTWLDSEHPEISIPTDVRQAFDQLSNLMNRMAGEGATEKEMITAKLDFIEAYDLPIRVDYQSMRNEGPISSTSGNSSATCHDANAGAWPTPGFLSSEVADGEDVEMFGGYYQWDGEHWVRNGGHCVVVTGAGTICGSPFVFWKHDRKQKVAGGQVQEGGSIDVKGGAMHIPGLDSPAGSFWVEGIIGESYDASVTDPGGGPTGGGGGRYCSWFFRTIRPGSKLVVSFPDSAYRCFNSTVWVFDRTVKPPVWRKKVVWNFNADTSRVIVNLETFPVTIAIHNDDHSPGGTTVGLDNPDILGGVTSPSNPGAFGGFSLGGADGSSGEFGHPAGTSATVDMSDGMSLGDIPAEMGGSGITSLTLVDPIPTWNPWWSHLELHMTVLSVTSPGNFSITGPEPGFPVTTLVSAPGTYEVDLGPFSPASEAQVVLQTDGNLQFEFDAIGIVSVIPVNLSAPGPGPETPVAFGLANLGPNPAGSAVRMRIDLPAAGEVELAMFDVRGARVATVAKGRFEPGSHVVTWNRTDGSGRRAAPGIYYGRLTVAGRVYMTRIAVLQ